MSERPESSAPGDPVRDAALYWRDELVDLAGPNTLLWPPRDETITVDLTTAHPAGLARVLAGRDTRLSDLVREHDAHLRVHRQAARLAERCQAIVEEHGVQTCFLTHGIATWDIPGAPTAPSAPVLLRRCTLRPVDGGRDLAVDLAPMMMLNPALGAYLERIGVSVLAAADLVALGRRGEGVFDPDEIYTALEQRCVSVPGFRITSAMGLGAYPVSKSISIADHSDNMTRITTHPVLRAIAGDAKAQHRVCEPGRTRGRDEDWAVIDATTDQAEALEVVAAGRHCFIEAPPGTGAATFVAATIAQSAHAGRSVLLVTEKTEAIRAVHRALAKVDLADLLLHVDDPAAGVNVTELLNRWDHAAEGGLPDPEAVSDGAADDTSSLESEVLEGGATLGDPRESASQARAAAALLDSHATAGHQIREPWGVTIAECQDAIVELSTHTDAPRSRIRLTGPILESITRDDLQSCAERVAELARLEAWRVGHPAEPWWRARLTSADDVEAAFAALERLRGGSVDQLRAVVDDVFAEITTVDASSVADLGTFLAAIEEVRDTLEVFRPEVFDTPLDHLIHAVDGPDDGADDIGWLERRRLRRQARALLRPGRPPEDLGAALRAAQRQRDSWADLVGGGGRPRIPSEIDRAHEAYEGVHADVSLLDDILAPTPRGSGLIRATWTDLDERVADLANDREGADIVPTVIGELDRLSDEGFGDLIDDLSHRQVPAPAVLGEVSFVWWSSVLAATAGSDPRYHGVSGADLTAALEQFVEADRRGMAQQAQALRADCRGRLAGVKRRQVRAMREIGARAETAGPLTTWRDALTWWSQVVRATAPAWAMSPLVVADVLPPKEHFDVVIIDDASRTSVARAAAAIARSSQVVIVGDPEQLPPAHFSVDPGAEPVDPPSVGIAHEAAELLPTMRLRESDHPRPWGARLPAVTGDREVVHPPAIVSGLDTEVRIVEGRAAIDEETGLIETTPVEVAAVIDAIALHLCQQPQESLGVVTFNERHTEEVVARLADKLRREPHLQEVLDALPEPFVIKDAGRWQREQRDHVIVTVGFGVTPHGRVVQRFGSITGGEGEQLVRLAATRGCARLTWVCAFGADDLDDERLPTLGGQTLRSVLAGLQAGPPPPSADDRGASPLLRQFAARLRTAGFVVHENFGEGALRVDLAIVDPDDFRRMLLAVEVDGPAYATRADARNRERVLVDRLRDLGWYHLRLWATDIFSDPAQQEARVIKAVRAATAERVNAR